MPKNDRGNREQTKSVEGTREQLVCLQGTANIVKIEKD